MTARRTALLLAVVVGFYLVVLGARGVELVATGEPLAVALGLAVLVLPVIGALLVWREMRFGQATERLARELDAQGGLPPDDLPRRPSGRPERAAADALYERMRAEVEAVPDDWRGWFRLSLAYDAAGDRRRARAAARHAVSLHDTARS